MTKRINGTQFVCLLLAGRLSACLLLPSDSLHALTVPDLAVVTLLNAALLLLLAVPTLALVKKGTLGVYLPIGLFVLYLDLLQFRDFAEQTVQADFSVTLLTVALIVAGLAAARYGWEALGRTATVITVVGVLVLLLFGVLLIPELNRLHFPPATFSGLPTVFRQVLKELPRTAEIVALWAVYPHVNGKVGRSFAVFTGLNAVLTLFVCLITTGVLGDFAAMTAYPFYTAVCTKRLDFLVVVLWLSTFFVRISLFGRIVLEHAKRTFGNYAFSAAVAVLTAAVILTRAVTFEGQWQIITYVYGGVLVFCTVGIPLLYGRKRS